MAGEEMPSQDGTEDTRDCMSVAHRGRVELTTPGTAHRQPGAQIIQHPFG